MPSPILISVPDYIGTPNPYVVEQKEDFGMKQFSSPRLLNYVEPYTFNGYEKTAFFTEVNTNFEVGDRVWILNSYYDSDNLLRSNKYANGSDGYRVLFIDNCKIVLDIDYVGIKPGGDDYEEFVNVYKISTRDEFISANRHMTTYNGVPDYKYNKNKNNIVFIDSNDTKLFEPIYSYKTGPSGSEDIYGWGVTLGIKSTDTLPGFYIKNNYNYWTDLTFNFKNYGTFSVALKPGSTASKIKIIGDDFLFNGVEFKQGRVYEWYKGATSSYWKMDKIKTGAVITKSNFRGGRFLGDFNCGVYGNEEKKINWENTGNFKGGTLYNMIWKRGTINSNIDIAESYKATLKSDGVLQKANSLDNGGWGWNYILDSYLEDANIENGTIINSTVVQNSLGNSSLSKLFNVVENHIKNPSNTLSYNINKAYFKRSSFSNYSINNAVLTETKLNDCKVVNSRIVNSQVTNSVIKDSTYISEDTIKILGIDEWSISDFKKNNVKTPLSNNTISSSSVDINDISKDDTNPTHKIFKFYIYDSDYEKLKAGDFFYIKGIKIKNNKNSLLNFFDRRFKVGNWFDFIDSYNDSLNSIEKNDPNYIYPSHESENFYKRGNEYSVLLSTPDENSWKLDFDTNKTRIGNPNDYSEYYSVDLVISLNDLYGLTYSTDEFNFNLNDIDIQDAYIINSHFESGIFETSDWNSGHHINYNNDVNISSLTGSGIYNIYYTNNKKLEIDLRSRYVNKYSSYSHLEVDFKKDDIVFLNNLEYIDVDGKITKLPDSYKIYEINNNNIRLEELNTNVLSGLNNSTQGTFSSFGLDNRWFYISKTKFIKSKIKSGLFKRNYFHNSLIRNENYDSFDKDFDNELSIKNLLVSDVIFRNNENILSSATYMNSFLIGGTDKWHDGIVYNSYLDSFTFSSGVIKESHWKNGNFLKGVFYNSRSFDSIATDKWKYLDSNRLKTSFRRGIKGVENNRWSWVSGNFYGGEFYKSDWEDGNFIDGYFNYSNFYNGTFSGGIIGDIKNSYENTIVFNANIDYTTVENATLFALNPSTWSGVDYKINWKDGVFNSGIFGSDKFGSSIWHNGQFNGGQFMSWAKWKDGVFNGGQFTSGMGWTQSGLRFGNSTTKDDYTWEGGIFNDGEFGYGNWLGTNSTWYNGEFNGGEFRGRVWNNGIFKYGNFNGVSSNGTASGDFNYLTYTESNVSRFADSYTQSFSGLWVDGVVTNKVDYPINSKWKSANFTNMLWLNGTFSSDVGIMDNSVFLDGEFNKGTFRNSSFNPFVKRTSTDTYSFSDPIWNNGDLLNSDFYYSEWNDGNFSSGDSWGMWFKNGISYYMNAYNAIFGTTNSTPIWKDGIWHGSDFNYGGEVTNPFIKDILNKTNLRNNLLIGTSSNHIWNIFDGSILYDLEIMQTGSGIKTKQPQYTPSFYQWIFSKNNTNDPYPSIKTLGSEKKVTHYTTEAYKINSNETKRTYIYWQDDAKIGTIIYELTTDLVNENTSFLVSDKDSFWINKINNKPFWATPIEDCRILLTLYKSDSSSGGYQLSKDTYLYYSDKNVINDTTNNWKFSYIKFKEKVSYIDTNNGTTKTKDNILVYEDYNDEQLMDVSVSIYESQSSIDLQFDTKNGKIDSKIYFTLGGNTEPSHYIKKIISNKDIIITPVDSLGPDSLWFPPFIFE
jgi:hypothetical protein